LTVTNAAALSAHSAIALPSEIRPVGRWRSAVRGFIASKCRSTIRLKLIAHVRAVTRAATTRRNTRQPGQPRSSRAATTIAASATGIAKIVWLSLTKDAHSRAVRIMEDECGRIWGCSAKGRTPLLVFLAPPGHQAMRHAEVVEHTGHHRVRDLLDRGGPPVERRIR